MSVDRRNVICELTECAPQYELLPEAPHSHRAWYASSLPLITGRGFSPLVDCFESVEISDGFLNVLARGRPFANSKKEGYWRLRLDTAHEFLIREATYFLASTMEERPAYRLKTEGLVYDARGEKPPVAQRGIRDGFDCEVLQYSTEAPPEFIEEVAREVEPRPAIQGATFRDR